MYHYFTHAHAHQPPSSNRVINRRFRARRADAQTFHTFLKHAQFDIPIVTPRRTHDGHHDARRAAAIAIL